MQNVHPPIARLIHGALEDINYRNIGQPATAPLGDNVAAIKHGFLR